MNNFFAFVFRRSNREPPQKERISDTGLLEDVEIRERIKKLIDDLKEFSAPGPDGLSPRLLKLLQDNISKPLSILFRKSMDDGAILDEWRDAQVTAIHNKGSKADPGNYRGVSLT